MVDTENKNLAAHEKPIWTVSQCCYNSCNLLAQAEKKSIMGNSMDANQSSWDRNSIAIFCDGSWFSSSRKGGYSTVANDGKTSMACIADVLLKCNSNLEAEIYGISAGLKLAEKLGIENIHISFPTLQRLFGLFKTELEYLESCQS